MKRIILLFIILFAAFLGTWTYRLNTPVNRPDEYAEGYDPDAGAWWKSGAVAVDDDWRLDPEIPLNYLPVPGENELYMVVDDDGKIIGYRKRTKQIDGSWLWEDTNPDIPDNYEPVEGLENVYKVTAEDGTVTYFKYIRNDDDTFAFVEVDENGNVIGKNRDATTIDGAHVHITGNIYSEVNEHGVVIGYDRRVDNGDGTFSWVETDLPELPDMSAMQGDMELPSVSAGDTPTLDTSDVDAMAQKMAEANAQANAGSTDVYNIDITENGGNTVDITPDTPTVINNGDGTHTEVEVVKETKNVDGWTTTYETYVKKTYDDAGNLISTISEGPYEVSSSQNITKETEPPQADRSQKREVLSEEFSRVSGSYTYQTDIESEVFALVNAKRTENGLQRLTYSEDADQMAKLRAADMAAYDMSSGDLPTYGSLGSMAAEYSVSTAAPGENLWKSIPRSADEIHTRFQAIESSRNTRMNEKASKYGIGIVEQNGYYYICEVFL